MHICILTLIQAQSLLSFNSPAIREIPPIGYTAEKSGFDENTKEKGCKESGLVPSQAVRAVLIPSFPFPSKLYSMPF